MNIGDILIKKNIITQSELTEISNKAVEAGISLEESFLRHGIPSDVIASAKADLRGTPLISLGGKKISFDILKQIPEEAARHYKFIPLDVKNGVLEVGMVDPDNIEAKEALQFIVSKLNLGLKFFLVSKKDFDIAIEGYKGLGGEVTKVLGELETELSKVIREKTPEIAVVGERFIEETPVTKMVAVILKHAVSGNASDIHIEPLRDKLRVRFRVDGILHTSLFLPINVHEAIISRIKILTNMKLDEKRKPQDGRFEAGVDNRLIDFRVSTLPTFFGEKVVIRVLDKEIGVKTLSEIGFSENHLQIVREALKKPYGMILLTGPTGSGKTTTLYAMLQELDKEGRNVVSLEDPIEYNIDGINQSQVRGEIGYDFANGLRSILRQDPDMIMVGEIRDKETAALAVQAALTGHMVFSTLHTNTAVGVISRLVDMGIDPYLIAPTLLLAVGQRLVRRMCADSKKPIPVTGQIKEKIEKELFKIPPEIKKNIKMPENIYQGVPSPTCPQGARGRFGIFEILYNSEELQKIIVSNPTEDEINKEARRQGMVTMREDGIMKLLNGEISLEELDNI